VKKTKKHRNGGPRPPIASASVLWCRLDQNLTASAAWCLVVVVVVAKYLASQTCQHMFVLLWEVTRIALRVMGHCHVDRGCLYERNGVKKIVLGALQVEIIYVHVFAHKHSPVY
jgi:hypothetical protein